jgi:hypothetical protein
MFLNLGDLHRLFLDDLRTSRRLWIRLANLGRTGRRLTTADDHRCREKGDKRRYLPCQQSRHGPSPIRTVLARVYNTVEELIALILMV